MKSPADDRPVGPCEVHCGNCSRCISWESVLRNREKYGTDDYPAKDRREAADREAAKVYGSTYKDH